MPGLSVKQQQEQAEFYELETIKQEKKTAEEEFKTKIKELFGVVEFGRSPFDTNLDTTCGIYMDETNKYINTLNFIKQRENEIKSRQNHRRAQEAESKSRSWRAGLKKPCKESEFYGKVMATGGPHGTLICSKGPGRKYYWLPQGNTGDPYRIMGERGRDVDFDSDELERNLAQFPDHYEFPLDPNWTQSNRGVHPSTVAQVWSRISPSYNQRVIDEATDVRDGLQNDNPDFWAPRSVSSEDAIGGGGKKKKSRKKSSQKKRKKSKKRTKRKVKNNSWI